MLTAELEALCSGRRVRLMPLDTQRNVSAQLPDGAQLAAIMHKDNSPSGLR